MREDMFKIIVERPRLGVRSAPRVKLRKDTSPRRAHVGMHRQAAEQAGWTKSLNENLAPLRRYIQKQKGRKWDDVFSEICQTLDTGSTVKMHVREHIEDFIMIRISVNEKGEWLGAGHWGRPHPPSHIWPDLYVDPYDNIIKDTRKLCKYLGVDYASSGWYIRRPLEPLTGFKWHAEKVAFVRLKGLWFEMVFNRKPKQNDNEVYEDIKVATWKYAPDWVVLSRKQLSKKSLKRHKLENKMGEDI